MKTLTYHQTRLNEYENFTKEIEKVCNEYRARGWTTDCGDFSGDEELAYEAYFEPPKPINGEHWLIHTIFKYFVSEATANPG